MYKLHISSRATKEIKKLSFRHKKAVINSIEEILEDPLLGKPLTRELTGRFSFRVGVYRIIYTINRKDKTIAVITVGHRATVYTT